MFGRKQRLIEELEAIIHSRDELLSKTCGDWNRNEAQLQRHISALEADMAQMQLQHEANMLELRNKHLNDLANGRWETTFGTMVQERDAALAEVETWKWNWDIFDAEWKKLTTRQEDELRRLRPLEVQLKASVEVLAGAYTLLQKCREHLPRNGVGPSLKSKITNLLEGS